MPGEDDTRDNPGDTMVWCGCERCSAGGDAALWRVLLAEGCGAALLLLLTCLPACAAPAAPAAPTPPAVRALTSGLVVALLVQCLDHVSGAHLNPAVTLAALLWGRVSRGRALLEAAAQLAGACAATAALALLEHTPPPPPALCLTLPADGLHAYKAVAIEATLGGCLALANCAAWDARTVRMRDSWPLRIGLAVAALSLVGGELTGASMNPVRSFAPALWSGNWTSHWVYWVGPLGGSALFTCVYLSAWRARAPRCDVTPRVVDTPPFCNKARAEP